VTERKIKDVAASVRQRLHNLSEKRGEDLQYILNRYASERFLYRIGISSYANNFVLKGALLFQLWSDQKHRQTRDVDLLGYGSNDIDQIEQVFRDICGSPLENDGLIFQENTVRGEEIRGGQEYGGVRVSFTAKLGKAKAYLQFDIGFGDVVTPASILAKLPTLLDFPPPSLRVYSKETLIAEKFEALVKLGIANSRMKDFYDLRFLAKTFDFEGKTLADAIKNTFNRRNMALPEEIPIALTDEFSQDRLKVNQWSAFLSGRGIAQIDEDFSEVITLIGNFLMPVANSLAHGKAFTQRWMPSIGWEEKS
jgi:predicted nucleotidyltransferase component of viral defense system